MTMTDPTRGQGEPRPPQPEPGPAGRPEPAGAGAALSGRVRTLLVGSLVLNLLLGGIFAGSAIANWSGRGGSGTRDLAFGPFTEALSRSDRMAMRGAFLSRMPDLRDARRAAQADFGEVIAAIRSTPFDRAALEAAFARLRERTAERIAVGEDLLVERIAQMPPEARLAFAARLEERISRGSHMDREDR